MKKLLAAFIACFATVAFAADNAPAAPSSAPSAAPAASKGKHNAKHHKAKHTKAKKHSSSGGNAGTTANQPK